MIRLEPRTAPSAPHGRALAGHRLRRHHGGRRPSSSRRSARTRCAALSGLRAGALQRPPGPHRAGAQVHAAHPLRARAVALLPLQRLEHRRRGAVPHGRRRRRRAGAVGHHRRAGHPAGAFFPLLIAGRGARRRGLGGHGGAAARPLQRQRDPGQPDAGLRRQPVPQLAGLRAVEGPGGLQLPADRQLRRQTEVPRLIRGMRLGWSFPVALVAALAMWLFMFRTYRGMQLQVGGPAPAAARYAGFSSRAAIWTTLLVSGGPGRRGRGLRGGRPHGPAHPARLHRLRLHRHHRGLRGPAPPARHASWPAWCSPPSSSAASWPSRAWGCPRRSPASSRACCCSRCWPATRWCSTALRWSRAR